MNYEIIENCSPYYIRFKWNGLLDLIKFVSEQPVYIENGTQHSAYTHYDFDVSSAQQIINLLPMKEFNFTLERVALFITPAGKISSIHKDGNSNRFSINIPIKVLDNKCITKWYSDNTFKNIPPVGLPYTRRIPIASSSNIDAVQTMIAQPNECILFNTDVYHSWDNSQSTNQRVVLTLRVKNSENIYFEDVKKILFGNVAESGLLQQS